MAQQFNFRLAFIAVFLIGTICVSVVSAQPNPDWNWWNPISWPFWHPGSWQKPPGLDCMRNPWQPECRGAPARSYMGHTPWASPYSGRLPVDCRRNPDHWKCQGAGPPPWERAYKQTQGSEGVGKPKRPDTWCMEAMKARCWQDTFALMESADLMIWPKPCSKGIFTITNWDYVEGKRHPQYEKEDRPAATGALLEFENLWPKEKPRHTVGQCLRQMLQMLPAAPIACCELVPGIAGQVKCHMMPENRDISSRRTHQLRYEDDDDDDDEY